MGGGLGIAFFFATASSHGIVGVLGLLLVACTYACVVVHGAMPVCLAVHGGFVDIIRMASILAASIMHGFLTTLAT